MDRASLCHRTTAPLALISAATLCASMLIAPDEAHAARRRGHRPHRATPASAQPEPQDAAPATTTTTTTTTTTSASAAATPAAETTPPPDTTPPPAPSRNSAANERDAASRPVAIDLQIALRVMGRSLWFVDDVFARLRPYSILGAPGVGGSLEWYPAAHVTSGRAAMFGVVVNGGYNFVLTSVDAQGRTYPTKSYDFFAGVRARLVSGRNDVGLVVGYAHQVFAIERGDVQAPPEGLPNVSFASVLAGLSARLQVSTGFAVTAAAAYMLVLGTGEIGGATYFPHMSTHGYDLGLGGAVELTSGVEARLGLNWRRYVMTMNPVPGENGPLIAGGAADDYFSATLGIAIRR